MWTRLDIYTRLVNKRNDQNKESTTIAQLTTHVRINMHVAQWLLPQYQRLPLLVGNEYIGSPIINCVWMR